MSDTQNEIPQEVLAAAFTRMEEATTAWVELCAQLPAGQRPDLLLLAVRPGGGQGMVFMSDESAGLASMLDSVGSQQVVLQHAINTAGLMLGPVAELTPGDRARGAFDRLSIAANYYGRVMEKIPGPVRPFVLLLAEEPYAPAGADPVCMVGGQPGKIGHALACASVYEPVLGAVSRACDTLTLNKAWGDYPPESIAQ